MEKIVVVDAGTSSMRAILFDSNGTVLKKRQENYKQIKTPNGRVEQEVSVLIKALVKALAHILNFEDDIAAIVLTSARSSVIPVDKNGDAISNGIMWQDSRSSGIITELLAQEDSLYRQTGMRLSNIISAPKMCWLKRHEPELYAKSAKLLGIQGFLLRKLTGKFITDYTFGNRTGLMDIKSRKWSEELLDMFHVDRTKLADLIPVSSICGSITQEASRLTGLKRGMPVISVGGDQQCASVGQGVVVSGITSVNTGSGAFLVRNIREPVLDPDKGLQINWSSLEDQYILEATVPAAGSLYKWFADLFTDSADEKRFKGLDREIENSPPGANGVIAIPSFAGRGSPTWEPLVRGAFLNIRIGNKRGDLARALLEGIVGELTENMEQMRRLIGMEERVYSSGGLSAFATYNQMLSDSFGSEIAVHDTVESTAMGAWIISAVILGYSGDYQHAYEKTILESVKREFHPNRNEEIRFKNQKKRRKKFYKLLNDFELK